jgi:predicted Fe-Mo cluster-binding NifX family protein
MMIKIAIPLFGDRISPRFDVAPTIGVFNIEKRKITDTKEISCEGWSDMERVMKLKKLGVNTVICGGIPNTLRDILSNNGIEVFPWVVGDTLDTLKKFMRGQIQTKIPQGKKRHGMEKNKRK